MLLVTSDPVINSRRELSSKKTGKLPLEVLNLSSGTENNNDSSDNN